MKKYKVITILGTRPEIIRLSCILPKLDIYFHHIFVYTNQNYDPNLSTVFFKDFELRNPDYLLNVKADTIGQQIGNILEQTEEILIKENPDALLILGDTNSALSAIIARRMKIPIFHMEAGNRSFDWNVPEETNRRIVDHISNFNLAYTEHARRNLISEGIHSNSIFVTGSPLAEVFEKVTRKIDSSKILSQLKVMKKKFFLISMHREENVDNKKNLIELVETINAIAKNFKLPIIISLHPRTAKRIKDSKLKFDLLVNTNTPFGFYEYNKLQKNALCVISDSGSIQEESAILGFNAIQIRKSTERPEAFDAGSIIVCGIHSEGILQSIKLAIDDKKIIKPKDYEDIHVSTKVIKLLLGNIAMNQ